MDLFSRKEEYDKFRGDSFSQYEFCDKLISLKFSGAVLMYPSVVLISFKDDAITKFDETWLIASFLRFE